MSGQGKNENPVYNWTIRNRISGKIVGLYDTRKEARIAASLHPFPRTWRVIRVSVREVKRARQ